MKTPAIFLALIPSLALLGLMSGPVIAAEGATDENQREASYLKLHPDFIVNLQTVGDVHFLLATIEVMSTDPEILELAAAHKAAIRHALLLLLGEQEYPDIKSLKARKSLQKKAVGVINTVLKKEPRKEGIDGLFFTHFVIE